MSSTQIPLSRFHKQNSKKNESILIRTTETEVCKPALTWDSVITLKSSLYRGIPHKVESYLSRWIWRTNIEC